MSLPTPYYDDGRITLYHGDCRDVLPRLAPASIDLLLTDPPYGVNWSSGLRQQSFGLIAGDDGSLDVRGVIALAMPALRKAAHLYVFGLDGWGSLPVGGSAELIWDKESLGAGDLESPWGPQHERILFGMYVPSGANRQRGDGRLAARQRRGSVLRERRATGMAVTRHPTEKPVGILREMIEASTLFEDVVLDPFAGSGSTLVAARLEGRKAIGIELEERYCAVAAGRLQQQALPLEVPA